jgi:signal transduction histidine kinase
VRRLLPASLLGQVMLSVALALLVAQAVSVTLLFRAGEERRQTAAITTAAFRLVNGAERAERREGRRVEGRNMRRSPEAGGARDGLPRPLRYVVTDAPPVAPAGADLREDYAERLRAVLAVEGVEPHAALVAIRRAGDDALLQQFAARRPRLDRESDWRERRLLIAAIQREPGGAWETARMIEPPRPQGALGVLLFQTLVTFAFLIVALFLVLRRITRPLARLTERVSDFSREPGRVVLLEETGPADTRRLIAAHNRMEARIAALLDEKDVMLGAIGHDLKTPLAALRVRIESVPDERQREKMADSIEDIAATLDDILSLARVGRTGGLDMESVDLASLAMGVVEEFEDLGEPVTIADPPRIVARVQVTWIKRALRNLVSNAVRYGGGAAIAVLREDGATILRVDDDGPGIPEGRIAEMMEPFTRGEASRNRATGGAGLGLTLARTIAEQHGGELVLGNRQTGGLRAEIRLPAG